MCGICGCGDTPLTHHQEHDNTEAFAYHSQLDMIRVEQNLLAKNDQFADTNRSYFLKNNIKALNVMSSPGSGKTTLLARTIRELKHQLDIAVIVGDQQTDLDAEKFTVAGAHAIQINTGKVCHLDAHAIGHSLEHLSLKRHTVLFIENVGNLVCPALFDLGEAHRVVLLSVTEGDTKPLKYPDMFRKADWMILTKTDLLPYVEFDTNKCLEYARRINPSIRILSLSSTTGAGLAAWYEWLKTPFETM